MQTHFFSREKKRVSDPKENRRGVPFRPGPPQRHKELPPLVNPLQCRTTARFFGLPPYGGKVARRSRDGLSDGPNL